MISAETSESRQPLRGRFASLDTSAAAKEPQLEGQGGPGRCTHNRRSTRRCQSGPRAGPTLAL